jgi:Flp pilus assembly protein TadG
MRLVERLEKGPAMMTFGMGKIVRNERGISAILIAGIMFFLVFMVGFAVDMGYMYVVKGQLQNAADAGALAGVKRLNPSATVFDQYSAKSQARKFAECNNVAECKPFSGGISLSTNMSYNTLDNSNDITVGNWNSSLTPQYDETRTPINAIKVRARRTTGSTMGQVNLFFSKVLSVVGYDWSRMSTAAEAIAALVPANIEPIIVNEYWYQNAPSGNQPWGAAHNYPNSFVRVTNVDGSPSLAYGKVFAILGADAQDNVPSSMNKGSKSVNSFIDLDDRSSNHDGLGSTWYSVNTSAPGTFDCTSCSNFFSPMGAYTNINTGTVNSQKFDSAISYLLNGYPANLPPPDAVKEQYRNNYPASNYPLNPTSNCPYATLAYFTSSGMQPIGKKNAKGQTFTDIFPAGKKIIVLVYDGTFYPVNDPSAPNAVTNVGYVAVQIDGYASSNPKGLTNKGAFDPSFLGSGGNTAYAHAISDIVEPATAGPGVCDTTFINALRALQYLAGNAALVK